MSDKIIDAQLAAKISQGSKAKYSELQQLYLTKSIDKLSSFKERIASIKFLDRNKSHQLKELNCEVIDFLINESTMVQTVEEPYKSIIREELKTIYLDTLNNE